MAQCNMRFTKRQSKDLEIIEYFIPTVLKHVRITDEDREAFLLISERGIYPQIKTEGVKALEQGKRWRGIHMFEMYEPGILDSSMPYMVILGGDGEELMPRLVVDFMKKEIFKGIDADLIEAIYQDKLGNKEPLNRLFIEAAT